MSELSASSPIQIVEAGLPGPSFTSVARSTGSFGAQPTDSDAAVMEKFADYAIEQNPGFKGDKGDPGAAGNVAANLSQLKAAATANMTMIYSGDLFVWTLGDFTGQADDVSVIKANSVDIDDGAWVRQRNRVSPYTFGAIGDGETLDTVAIQAAIDNASKTGLTLDLRGGTFACGPLTITDAANFILDAGGATIRIVGDMSVGGPDDDHNRMALFMFLGTCAGATFRGLNVIGDSIFAHRQRVFGYVYDAPPSLSDIKVLDCHFQDVTSVSAFPGVQRLDFARFTIKNLLGEESGQGYGIATEMSDGVRSYDVNIGPGEIDNSTRHGIYINHTDVAKITAVTMLGHRKDLFSASTGTTGRAAMILSRSTQVTVVNCVFDRCHDAALQIDQDNVYVIRGVTVSNCVFNKILGASIRVGRTGNSGDAGSIRINNIELYLDGSWADPDINISDVQDFTLDDTRIYADVNYASTKNIIALSEYSASYWKRVLINNVRGVISSAGSAFLIDLSPGLSASSGGTLEFLNNQVDGATRLYLWNAGSVQGACTNSNVRTDWTHRADITVSGTPSIAGYNRFSVALASTGNISGFANGYDGQAIELSFANGNATLTNAMYLAGAVNFAGTSVDQIRLQKQAAISGNWAELGRSVN